MGVHPWAGPLIDLVAPPSCASCRLPLGARSPGPLCRACLGALPWLDGRRCPRCALPEPCRPCPARGAAFQAAWAPLAYSGPARAVVGALKFRGALPLAHLMAAHIASGAPEGLLEGAHLVPVPAAPARRRARGFDHADLLAGALAAASGRPLWRGLRRCGPATRQVGAARSQRLAGGRLDVRVTGPVPARALLVDDVHTTGATLEACARALRGAGCERVAAVTYARTLGC